MASEYTQGVCEDGAAILKDGQPMTVEEILSELRAQPHPDYLLADKHTGMKISAQGILGRIADGRYFKDLNYGCGVLLRHLEEMAQRFYAGDVKVVDEFLQLYDLDDERPNPESDTPLKRAIEACALTPGEKTNGK